MSVDWRWAVAASLSHAHAKVVEMVGDVELPGSPLIGTSAVFTDVGAATVNCASLVFILLLAYVPVCEQRAAAWVVNHHILEVGNTPEVGHDSACKSREVLVTYTR